MHKGGKEYRRLVSAFERIFGAPIFFGTDQIRSAAKLVQRSRFNFLREAQSWYNREPDQPVLSDEFENVIVLSDEFYREITEHPIMSAGFLRRAIRIEQHCCQTARSSKPFTDGDPVGWATA